MKNLVWFLLLGMPLRFAYGADEICARHVVLPNYPAIALTARVQATMSIELTISMAGKVLYANASGHPLFKTAAEETLKKWTFAKVDPAWGLRVTKIPFDYGIADSDEAGVTLDLPDHVTIRALRPHFQTNYSSAKIEVQSANSTLGSTEIMPD
jgi:hypothetical protein